ncbi:MAG: acyl-CoA dehydrogenase family protein [Acidobacteriota bacterium]
MDFILSGPRKDRFDEWSKFASENLGDDLVRRDREGIFERSDWEACGRAGVQASLVAQRWGGKGLSAVDTVLMMEALGYGCGDNGLTLALGGHMWSVQEPIEVYGSDEQRERYLPGLMSGELIGAHGVSEETSGSDALSLRTTARRVDGGYVLNGRKVYIGMAPAAGLALVLANTDPEAGKWGVSAFLIESGAEGFRQSEPVAKSGTRTNLLGDLVLEDCFVPENQRLGKEGLGLSLFTRSISWERAFIHAGHIGAMQRLLERCVEYSRERKQFGQPIGEFQSVSNRLADMRVRQETSRLLMYKVAAMKDAGADARMECAMAKLHISEALLDSAEDAVRIHGARGYLEEFGVERELRDALGGVIYAGTSDIQRNVIAALLRSQ